MAGAQTTTRWRQAAAKMKKKTKQPASCESNREISS
jgi:hypothetical protein